MASNQKSTNTPEKTVSAGLPAISDVSSSSNVPAFMQGAQAADTGFDVSDLIIPRVALMQGISPPVMAGEVENAHFYHTTMGQDMGTEIDIVPILYRKQYTLWNPLHMGGGVIARASDGKTWDSDFDVQVAPYKDFPKKLVRYSGEKGGAVGKDIGLGAWGSADPENPDSGPAATVSHIFMFRSLQHFDLGPFIVFLQRSSEGVARDLMTKIRLVQDGALKVPMHGQVYRMTSKVAANNGGQEYNQYKFIANGYVPSQDMFDLLVREREEYGVTRFRTNDEDAQSEDQGGGRQTASAPDSKDDKY